MTVIHTSRAPWLATAAALLLAACGSESSTGVDEQTLAANGGANVGTNTAGGAPSSTRASACNGTLGAITVELVNVPAGATCTLNGTRVHGDVKVARGATVVTNGARIGGNVQAEDANTVAISANTVVIGDVQAKRRAAVRIANSTIDGNLQVEEAGASLQSTGNRIGGDLQVVKAASATIGTTTVNGNLQLTENSGALASDGATVRGNLQVVKNRGGVTLTNNRVQQVLECKENVPAPTGIGNVAGELTGQCATLGSNGNGGTTPPSTPPTTPPSTPPTNPPTTPTPPTTSASACNGTIGAITVDEVRVPSGASCILDGTRVQGNVLVARDGSVSANGARIIGNIQAEDARRVATANGTTVGGSVQVKRRAVADVQNTTITGSLQIEEAGASLTANNVRIGGNLQVIKAGAATIGATFVNGDLQLEENRGALASTGAEVRGNFQVFKNLGGVTLRNNRVQQVLECKENVPAPTGSGNVAGEKKEQCVAL